MSWQRIPRAGAAAALLFLWLGGSAAAQEEAAAGTPPAPSVEEVVELEPAKPPAEDSARAAGEADSAKPPPPPATAADAAAVAAAKPPLSDETEQAESSPEPQEAPATEVDVAETASSVSATPGASAGVAGGGTVGLTAAGPEVSASAVTEADCSSFDQLRGTCGQSDGPSLPFSVGARVQYWMPSFIDKDPENELGMSYHLRVEYRPPVKGLSLSAFVGMTQAFYAVEDESPLLMDDLFVSAGYWHGVSLADAGWDRELRFYHRLRAYFPTSRQSQNQSLYIAPEWLSAARLEVVDGLTLGVNLSAEYDFHRYAERAGMTAGMNTRLFLGGGVVAQYELFNHARWGSMIALAGAGLRYFLLYPSSEEFESDGSDQNLWKQDYAWSVGLSYSPVRYVSLEVSLAQNYLDVRRNGVRQGMNQFTAQDQIQWVFALWGRY